MNALTCGPPKENAPAKGRSSKLTPTSALVRACQILRLVQWPFASVFWAIERCIAALDVEIERRRQT
jgi:hypothetical protein